MDFNSAQKKAIENKHPLVVISAGAGSGKTRVLTERIMYILEKAYHEPSSSLGATIEELAAITFTEKAAREMKDRVRKRLAKKELEALTTEEADYWKTQKELVERALISTFHSFCQQLLGQHAMAANLPPTIRIIDEVEARQLKRETIKTLMQNIEFTSVANEFFQYMSKDQLISVIEEIHANISELVVGEEAITQLDPDQMLEKQTEAMIMKQQERVSQFHHEAQRLVREFPSGEDLTKAQQAHVERLIEAFQAQASPTTPNQYIAWLQDIMPKRTDKKWEETVPALYELFEEHWKPLKEDWKSIGGEVEIDEVAQELLGKFVSLLGQFHLRYKKEKDKLGVVDFSDLQQKAVALLEIDHVKKSCQQQYKHMLIDEFQDTNRLQLEMLNRIQPVYRFIVGDTKQSIYRFRGANVRLMNELEKEASEQTHADAIDMNINYRTCRPIIQGINELFSSAMSQEITESFQTRYTALEADRESEDAEKLIELIVLPEDEDETDEINLYDQLASRVTEMVRSGKPRIMRSEEWQAPMFKDIAVLIPARTNLLKLERALSKKQIPYTVYGGIGFYDRQEVIDVLALLRWLNRPFEDSHLLAILRSPLIGLTMNDFLTISEEKEESQSYSEFMYNWSEGEWVAPNHIKEALKTIQAWVNRYVPLSAAESMSDVIYQLLVDIGFIHSILVETNGLQKVKNVEKILSMIDQYQALTLEELLQMIDERMALSDKEGEAEMERSEGNALHIMTVHASKGLEFPIVCLPQLERPVRGDSGKIRFHPQLGLVMNVEEEAEQLGEKKIQRATPGYELVKDESSQEAEEEAKRLFYVATTRAKDYLFMIGKEPGAKKSWLHLVDEAKKTSGLEQYVIEASHIPEQAAHQPTVEIYHKAPISSQKEVLLPLSVSEIMTFMEDPNEYYDRYILGIQDTRWHRERQEESTDRKNAIDPTLLGTIVHRACELRDYGFQTEAAIYEALLLVEDLPQKEHYLDEIKKLMEAYSDEQKEALGRPVANEWSFAVELAGAEVIGEIDKVVRRDGLLHLIDFKTNQVHKAGREWLKKYDVQLHLYKMAYENVTGMEISSMSLYLLRDQEQPIHAFNDNPEKTQHILDAITKLVYLKKTALTRDEFLAYT
ncbi:UvrD-helicase domain-containing protein [Bacillus sp. FJAT-45037]|uniref:UvrD-helicase domain-containing protein n=1 Tax=Bacillus sp. FJAT-45037 TaxID=2011007 RepID=UPI000C230440|nr:UvrD-helicase domain-containing protein [Bacillus sp. FJAT-45037]